MSKIFTPSKPPFSLDVSKSVTRKSVSILGTALLVLGFGISGSSQAIATELPVECLAGPSGNIIEAVTSGSGGSTAAQINFDNLDEAVNDDALNTVCLDGDFQISQRVSISGSGNRNVRFIGIGSSSIESTQGVFMSDVSVGFFLHDIRIDNLTVKNSTGERAVQARNVDIFQSTFTGNSYGAIFAQVDVEVTESTFIENSGVGDVYSSLNWGGAIYTLGEVFVESSTFLENVATDGGKGGAIYSYSGDVTVDNSTFEGNRTEDGGFGGAIYSGTDVFITNSTFLSNEAGGANSEGGAVFAFGGQVRLSTFVDNLAATPTGGDIPGNAIYKSGTDEFVIAGNIFVGSSTSPQLGVGAPQASPFSDAGGNVYSNSSAVEEDVVANVNTISLFAKTKSSLFGSEDPQLATHQPNTFGTQAISLIAGSPAINVVPEIALLADVSLDQSGTTRSRMFDAGAFEYVPPTAATVAPPTAATPAALARTGAGSAMEAWTYSFALLAIGVFALLVTARPRSQRV